MESAAMEDEQKEGDKIGRFAESTAVEESSRSTSCSSPYSGSIRPSPSVSVVVVGGSIAGLSCAHAILRAGCRVLVLEKARSLTAAGAGLGLDSLSCFALDHWGLGAALMQHTLPLSIEENRAVDSSNKVAYTLAKDENYNHRAAHWSDLHRILYDALPAGTVRWGHEVVSFEEMNDGSRVRANVMIAGTCDTIAFDGDVLVAADGSMSQTRSHFMPLESRRYCGYCAWRGVLDISSEGGSEVYEALRKEYPNLGYSLYFDIADRTHAVLYELPGGRLNWLWYVNQSEPQLKGTSVTAKADEIAIAKMHADAARVWMPELSALMQLTPAPFINAIFDREPLLQLVWGRVVLVGEAAHPTSPHGLRSTNMSILDAAVLGESFAKYGSKIQEALDEYQSLCMPVTSQQVLFSRYLGQLKQGFISDVDGPLFWSGAKSEVMDKLLQRNIQKFEWPY